MRLRSIQFKHPLRYEKQASAADRIFDVSRRWMPCKPYAVWFQSNNEQREHPVFIFGYEGDSRPIPNGAYVRMNLRFS